MSSFTCSYYLCSWILPAQFPRFLLSYGEEVTSVFSISGCGGCSVQRRRLGAEAVCGKALSSRGAGAAAQGLPHVQDQEQLQRRATSCPRSGARPTGDIPRPRSGAAAALCWSSRKEIHPIQHKRNPSKMVGVARGHQRAEDWNHNHRQLVNLITWTAALSNSMKLSHAVWGHPRQWGHGGEERQIVVHWRREWQTTSVFLPWEPHEQYETAKW